MQSFAEAHKLKDVKNCALKDAMSYIVQLSAGESVFPAVVSGLNGNSSSILLSSTSTKKSVFHKTCIQE